MSIRLVRLSTGDDGQSHFTVGEVAWTTAGGVNAISAKEAVADISFEETAGGGRARLAQCALPAIRHHAVRHARIRDAVRRDRDDPARRRAPCRGHHGRRPSLAARRRRALAPRLRGAGVSAAARLRRRHHRRRGAWRVGRLSPRRGSRHSAAASCSSRRTRASPAPRRRSRPAASASSSRRRSMSPSRSTASNSSAAPATCSPSTASGRTSGWSRAATCFSRPRPAGNARRNHAVQTGARRRHRPSRRRPPSPPASRGSTRTASPPAASGRAARAGSTATAFAQALRRKARSLGVDPPAGRGGGDRGRRRPRHRRPPRRRRHDRAPAP